MHIVSAALTFCAFLVAAFSQRFGFIAAAVLAGISWLVSVITIAVDLALFLPARSKLRDSGATVSFGIGFWCTVAAIVLLFVGAIATVFSVCTDRKKKNEPDYASLPPPMAYAYGQPAMVPLVQQPIYYKA